MTDMHLGGGIETRVERSARTVPIPQITVENHLRTEYFMKRTLQVAIPGVLLSSALAFGVAAQTAVPELTLTRLDCGGPNMPVDVARFSDTNAYDGKKIALTGSCYLIKHGEEYMLWDTGYPAAVAGSQPPATTPKN